MSYTTIIADFLARSQLEYCHRGTLRALLPVGTIRSSTSHNRRKNYMSGRTNQSGKNRTSIRFQDALRMLEQEGMIQRGTEFVQVLNPGGLSEIVRRSRPISQDRLAYVDRAISRVRAEIEAEQRPRVVELRRQELLALQRMMTDVRGEQWSGRGAVRFVSRGKTL
jgi:hypothetical protein